jgi:tetrapyrrole methylase family protein/MazG family protein
MKTKNKKNASNEFIELLAIMQKLRDECPWDKIQTAQSLRQFILEEAYEVIHTIDQQHWNELCAELGDLLLQIVFQSIIASEKDHFDITDVIDHLNNKLKKRHPHVFDKKKISSAEAVEKNWENIKITSENRKSLFSGIPRSAPALLYAQRLQEKASRVGFDWSNVEGVLDKFHEEFIELKKALRSCNKKFQTRFQYIEKHFKYDYQKISKATIEELDSLWEKSKEK